MDKEKAIVEIGKIELEILKYYWEQEEKGNLCPGSIQFHFDGVGKLRKAEINGYKNIKVFDTP